MKKVHLISLALTVLLVLSFFQSCKKASTDNRTPDDNNYYIRFKANGVQQNITYLASISYDHSTSPTELHSCFGISSDPSGSQAVYLTLWNTTAFVPNMTLHESVIIAGASPQILFTYSTNTTSKDYKSAGDFDLHPSLPRNFSLKITAFTSESVKGTFSGTLYQEKSGGEPDITNKLEITEGEFNLKRS
jgi:hypothetical protein